MPTETDLLFEAVSFAARAHRHQVRKDGITPYTAHVFRVCLVLRHIFGIDDPKVLAAALLHDTIEDTPTDYDDLAERFGDEVAGWAAALTKDMRLKDEEREAVYCEHLASAVWPVQVCKLADIYDNLNDSKHLPLDKRGRTLERSKRYLDTLRTGLKPEAKKAMGLVENLWVELRG